MRLLCTTLLVLAALAAPASAQQPVFTVTAPTGVHTVSEADFAHWTRVARREGRTAEGARLVAMQLLLEDTWILAEAAERGLAVSDATVEAEHEAQWRSAFGSRRAYRRWLRRNHQTEADIRRRMRLDLLQSMIREHVARAAEATVTDAVVHAYVAEHGNVRIPERRAIRIVRTRRRAAALAAKRELLAGGRWSSVARRYSIDEATRRIGGRVPARTRGMFERALGRRVFAARRGHIGGPVRTRSGYYVFRVSRVVPERELSTARSRQIVRWNLVARAVERALDRFAEEFEEKWRSRTVCAPAYVRYCAEGLEPRRSPTSRLLWRR